MNGFVTAAVVLVGAGWPGGPPLDKTGTTRWQVGVYVQQTPEKQEPARAGSFQAEREGISWPHFSPHPTTTA